MDQPRPSDPAPPKADNLLKRNLTPSQIRGLLALGAAGVTRELRAWQPPSVEELQRLLPQYEISAFIARGGMGAVYKGVQRTLKRTVAIKILPPDIEDGNLHYAERFKHEAQAMARLSHPNIVTVYDAGEVRSGGTPAAGDQDSAAGDGDKNVIPSDGKAARWGSTAGRTEEPADDAPGGRALPPPRSLLYFVMEFIEGTDVAQLIASEGRLDARRAAPIITAVCEALAFAHEEGIIHRDIKPSNVMIDKKGRVKVADFGLAKVVNAQSTLLTGSNVAMGTPDFIAPEALIPGTAVDGRADIYAVGVMLYQMLTGQVPRGRFSPPSIVVPKTDKRLDRIVDKAMQTDREKRYSSAVALKADVEKVSPRNVKKGSADTPVRTPSSDAPQQRDAKANEAGRRARVPILIGGAAALVIGVTVWLLMDKPVEAEARAESPAAAGSANAALAGASALPPATYPASQWVKVFARAEDVPASAPGASGIRWEGEWLQPGRIPCLLVSPAGHGDQALRARFRYKGPGERESFLQLRVEGWDAYVFRVEEATCVIAHMKPTADASRDLGNRPMRMPEVIATAPLPVPLNVGDEYTLEFAAFGSRLIGRFNEQVVCEAVDDRLPKGKGSFFLTGAASAMAVMRLEGLSESEALKLVSGTPPPSPLPAIPRPSR